MNDPLLAFRAEFPILERTTYLVSHSLGAMPRTVPDRLAEYVDAWAELGVRAWANGWWSLNRAICSANFSILRPAAIATTRKSPKCSITLSELQPIEPVEPRMEMPFIRQNEHLD